MLLAILCTQAQGLSFVPRRAAQATRRISGDEENQAAVLVGGVAAGITFSVGSNLSVRMRTCFTRLDCIESVRPLLSDMQQYSIALAVGALAMQWAMAHASEIGPMIFGPTVTPQHGNSRIGRLSASKTVSKKRRFAL